VENDLAKQLEEMRRRRKESEGDKAHETRAEEARHLAERHEREAIEVEAKDPELAAELRHDAALLRDVARESDEASARVQELAEDAEPFEPGSDREEGGEA
jgi:hypothetical protein